MSTYRDQVSEALGAVKILGPTQYAWLGRKSRRLRAALERDLNDAERRRYLVSSLGDELYFSFYCHGTAVTARSGMPQPAASEPRLLEAMSRANTGCGSREPGWTVARVEADDAVVSKAGVRVRIPVSECDGDVAPGAAVSLRLPKDLPSVTPGSWTVLGDVPLDASSRSGLVRVYWNVSSSGAAALVRAVSERFNQALVPFELKLADHPLRFARCDSAILYVRADAFAAVRATLAEIAVALAGRLRPDVPAFTLELVPGVGLAEDRDDGQSFGARRCALLSDAIVRGHERGLTRRDERLDLVAGRFAEAGVQIDAPYLEPSLVGRHVL
jgi:class II lanthipeptide synthase